MTTTRTIGPLHFEDLEPHRFEDLVRQLAYDFRQWRSLEATGRGGADGGFDARGWEMVQHEALAAVEQSLDSEEDETIPTDLDRLWLIQCKRERAIGPTKLRGYLKGLGSNGSEKIYGIVFAASCDFSKQARDAFRTLVRELGFSEGALWGKAEIEDMLFQPKNDHLLFAYLGVSLQARRRTLKTEVRARLAAKRKAARMLKRGFVLGKR